MSNKNLLLGIMLLCDGDGEDSLLDDDFLQGESGDEGGVLLMKTKRILIFTFTVSLKIELQKGIIMEEMSAICGYESMDDLKHKLLYTTLELQKMKMKANVRLREQKDTVQHLLNLLANACKERDGARDQLQALLYRSMSSGSSGQILSRVLPESPISNTTPKANLSVLESNSEAFNQLSHCSSSVDSFFDAGSSPDFPNKNLEGSSTAGLLNQLFVQEQHNWTEFTGKGSASEGKTLASCDGCRSPPPITSHNRTASSVAEILLPLEHLSFTSNSTGAPSCSGWSNARIITSSAKTNSQIPLHKRQRATPQPNHSKPALMNL
ncbi:ENABLED-LIKE PROTEIN (DUF1635) [Salix koriyanagi]|uniref:ENABLED-LIKE PROTEIN (DUF1635) n=1 Tax=Salix koriyanagi TaxID=2511006 RepID=A0A9Q0WIS7_9ROSI|nr:ENABLED-LIKE PROTEIN (DUF1635) [Salix koriyanagi]